MYAFGRIIGYEEKLNGSAATKYWTITDHLGSVMAEADDSGTILDATGYADFGAPGMAPAARVNGHEMLQRYTGKDYDPITELYYFNARWQNQELGRFITKDPIRDGVNWFIFCNNNPLRFTDPTGLAGDPLDPTNTKRSQVTTEIEKQAALDAGRTQEIARANAILADNPSLLRPSQSIPQGELTEGPAYNPVTAQNAAEINLVAGNLITAVTGQELAAVGSDLVLQPAFPGDVQRARVAVFAELALAVTGMAASRVSQMPLAVDGIDDLAAAAGNGVEAGEHTVYALRDPVTGDVRYVGRTINPTARQAAHAATPGRAGLDFAPLREGLTYPEARGWEQRLFEQYGGFDELLNKINPISPKNPNISIYLQAAQ